MSAPFAGQDWKEVRFDINQDAKLDLIGTMNIWTTYSPRTISSIYPLRDRAGTQGILNGPQS
jgi:hypothetical protein